MIFFCCIILIIFVLGVPKTFPSPTFFFFLFFSGEYSKPSPPRLFFVFAYDVCSSYLFYSLIFFLILFLYFLCNFLVLSILQDLLRPN